MRRAIKILVYVGAFSALVLVVMGFRGSSATRAIYEDTFRLLGALPESVDVAEGARLTTINGCRDCHGEDLAGRVFIDAPPFLVVAPNLTTGAGGVAAAYRTAADWDRAIRYRIRPDGRGLLPMMPSENYHYMSDEDLAGIIAYLRSAPPIDNELPETKVRLMGAADRGRRRAPPRKRAAGRARRPHARPGRHRGVRELPGLAHLHRVPRRRSDGRADPGRWTESACARHLRPLVARRFPEGAARGRCSRRPAPRRGDAVVVFRAHDRRRDRGAPQAPRHTASRTALGRTEDPMPSFAETSVARSVTVPLSALLVCLLAMAGGGSRVEAQETWWPSQWGAGDERGAANRLTPRQGAGGRGAHHHRTRLLVGPDLRARNAFVR